MFMLGGDDFFLMTEILLIGTRSNDTNILMLTI